MFKIIITLILVSLIVFSKSKHYLHPILITGRVREDFEKTTASDEG
jgi:hypothetical protein